MHDTDADDDAQHDRARISPVDHPPLSASATLDLADGTVTDLWRDLFDSDAVREAFVRAVRAFASDRTTSDLYDALDDRDVPRHLHGKIDAVARGDRRRAWHLAADVVPTLGAGWTTVDDMIATARLFDALPTTPTLAVRVGRDFRDRRRSQRVDCCRLLATLAVAFDVRLVATGLTRAWLAREHRESLPGVSEWCNTNPDRSPVADRVESALATLNPDGREVSILRSLDDTPGETRTYHALYADAHVDESRVRQCLTHLSDLGLVEPFGPVSDRKVDLLDAGRELLSALTQQSTLSDAVSGTPQDNQQAVYSGAQDWGPGDSRPYRTAHLSRPAHTAAVACGAAGGVSLVSHPEDPGDTDRTRWVSYDEDRDEAVIDVRATGAMQYTVSVATALSSPEFIDRALSADRLDAVDDPPAILRDARCVGWLSEDALTDGQTLRDALVDAGRKIADLTRDMKQGEYDDRDGLRSDIMRLSHGLAGSIVHLLDAVGVDLTRVVRVPGGLSFDHLDALAESVGVSAAIQSRYRAFAVYRQLFEDREDKRRSALTPDVDAADPMGTLIGSFVFRGPDVDRLQASLEDHVGTPRALADDAPEFAVHIPIQSVDRRAFAMAATRTLSAKNLRVTRQAVSLLHSLTGSPYDVAEALHQLSSVSDERDLRVDEVRYGLATLDADRILPDLPRTVGAIVSALLTADERLSQADLAERADVSAQSIRRHRDRLESLGLVERTDAGYRLTLSFRTREERRTPVVPEPVTNDRIDSCEVLLDPVIDAVDDAKRLGDPDDPLGAAFYWPPDYGPLRDRFPDLNPWIDAARRLCNEGEPGAEPSTVSIGPPLEQTPLQEVTTEAMAD